MNTTIISMELCYLYNQNQSTFARGYFDLLITNNYLKLPWTLPFGDREGHIQTVIKQIAQLYIYRLQGHGLNTF